MDNLLKISNTTKTEIQNYMPTSAELEKLALFFQVFSDPTRLKILSALSMRDLCVNDLSKLLNINQTTLSHQLKQLKTQEIVGNKRNGKIITYFLKNKYINDILLFAVNNK